ncbi:MAG: YihY/virulence factor BrkB family protein [Gemmatimonadales bacterium]
MPFLASALTFDGLLAAIPLGLLLFAGLGLLLQWLAGAGPIEPAQLIERFLPPHPTAAGRDPFETVEAILGRLTELGRSLSLLAIPAFLWFSTRLFAGIRTALNSIYDVGLRPPKGHYLVRFLLAKLRDLGMVLLTLVLFLAYTTLTSGFALLRAYLDAMEASVVTRSLEGWLAELIGLVFLVALFFFLYRHASLRRVRWQAALVAAGFMAVAFEIARRLYSLYLRGATSYGAAAVDASIGAIVLFVVWLYFAALVFLLGGVIAETWELRELQRVQRGGMARSTETANVPVE